MSVLAASSLLFNRMHLYRMHGSVATKVGVLVVFLDLISSITAAAVSSAVLALAWNSNHPSFRCAFDIAVNQINNNSTLLPDTQLLYRRIPTDCSQLPAVDSAMVAAEYNLAPQKCGSAYVAGANGPTVAIVGAWCSSSSIGISSVSNLRHIPLVAYGSTAVSLSNKLGELLFLTLLACSTVVV